jgi:hypothetical protein
MSAVSVGSKWKVKNLDSGGLGGFWEVTHLSADGATLKPFESPDSSKTLQWVFYTNCPNCSGNPSVPPHVAVPMTPLEELYWLTADSNDGQ